jgi:Cytochrome b(C-terminal)/b6/petD
VIALIILLRLASMTRGLSFNHFIRFKLLSWRFVAVNVLLIWLGIQPVERPFVFIGQLLRVFYFVYFFLMGGVDVSLGMLLK